MNELLIEQALLRTIIFFDLFEYPLTLLELWKNLFFYEETQTVSLNDCAVLLKESSLLFLHLEKRSGYYCLKGRADIIDLRVERALIADRKYRKAKKISELFACLPFVRMVCICNTLGISASPDNHDIDFFIVGRRGFLRLTRLLCTGAVHVFGKRPKKNHERDTFCLSFYVADDALDLSSLQIPGSNGLPDIYLLYWITWCVPLYDENTYKTFYQANTWIERYVPNRLQQIPIPRRQACLSSMAQLLKRAGEWCIAKFGLLAESVAKTIQYRVGSKEIMNRANRDTSVVMNERILKFHLDDRREELREKFLKKCADYHI